MNTLGRRDKVNIDNGVQIVGIGGKVIPVNGFLNRKKNQRGNGDNRAIREREEERERVAEKERVTNRHGERKRGSNRDRGGR